LCKAYEAYQSLSTTVAKSEWFSRVWTFQEIALAKRAIVICGRHQFQWQQFAELMSCRPTDNDSIEWLDNLQLRVEIRQTLESVQMVRGPFRHSRYDIETMSSVGLDALFYKKTLKATDARDQVYGLLAMARRFGLDMAPPDYQKTLPQVFEDLTFGLIRYTRKLDVIYQSTHNDMATTSLDHLPSWVFNWILRGSSVEYNAFLEHLMTLSKRDGWEYSGLRFYASGVSQFALGPGHQEGVLLVSGVLLGTIQKSGRSIPGVLPNESIADFLTTWTESVFSDVDGAASDNQRRCRLSATDALIDILFKFVPRMKTPVPSLFRKMELTQRQLADLTRWKDWVNSTFTSTQINKKFEEPWYFPDLANSVRGYINSGDLPHLSAISHGKPFRLSSGYIGLANSRIEHGDRVIVAAGSSVPLVLRQQGSEYSLISASYIPGVMYGEAWHHRDQPDFDYRPDKDFKWRLRTVELPDDALRFRLV
jgi:hypothetical protein